MKLTLRLTMDGLIRALRTRADIAADERAEAARRETARDRTEDRDEQRRP